MIKVSAFYPNRTDATFDMQYYVEKHIPLLLDRCGGDVALGGVERALAGGAFGLEPPYCAVGHLLFDSRAIMERSFGQHIPELLADVPNFTNVQPIVQISEVVIEPGRRL